MSQTPLWRPPSPDKPVAKPVPVAEVVVERPTREMWDEDAEESVIAACLVDPVALSAILGTGIQPTDFWTARGEYTFGAILGVIQRRGVSSVGQITVAHELGLAKAGPQTLLEVVGGMTWLSRVVSELPTSIGAEWYARIVLECAQNRRLQAAAAAISDGKATAEQAMALFSSLVPGSGVISVRRKVTLEEEVVFRCHSCPREAVAYDTSGRSVCPAHAETEVWG